MDSSIGSGASTDSEGCVCVEIGGGKLMLFK